MDITRQVFWNIENVIVYYILAVLAVAIFVCGFYKRSQLWRIGRGDKRFNLLGKRIWALITFGFGHKRILKELYPGIMHLFVFWGFLILFLGTILLSLTHYLVHIFYGSFYLIYSLTLDVFGLFALVGIVVLTLRRYVQRPEGVDSAPDDAFSLLLIFCILLTGFGVEGLRIAEAKPYFEIWSPIGWSVAKLFSGMEKASILAWHQTVWWVHLVISLGFIAYLPYSKLFHIFLSPANQFFQSFAPKGALAPVAIPGEKIYGANSIERFTWKQLMDLFACTNCGRCQNSCPAYLSHKPLTPKGLIQDLKSHLIDEGKHILENKGNDKPCIDFSRTSLTKTAISEDTIWACLTCRACQECCPVFIEHVDKVVEMRRHLVLMESWFPAEIERLFRNLEIYEDPWGIGPAQRADWERGLNITRVTEGCEVDILYWVGCAGALDERYKGVATSLVRVLQASGVNFGILGKEERCCGDVARRTGNEYVFQALAKKNIESLNKYKFKKILTSCPHCYNTFKNEYSQFGGTFKVVHHSEFLLDLIQEGKLEIARELDKNISYHDSCYLGRYNGIYEAPRKILKHIPKINTVELGRNRDSSFCCGAGGGLMWMDESGERINILRLDEMMISKPDIVVTACPYCLTMFEDGINVKEVGGTLKAMDLVEIVEGVIVRKC